MRLARRVLGTRQMNQLVRFAPVVAVLRAEASQGSTLLDVGSGSEGLTALLPASWEMTVLDADFSDYGAADGASAGRVSAVIGDVRALPFEAAAFDSVVALDLLEHVAPADRPQAISELCRVAARRVVIACPAGEEALAADARVATWLRSRGRTVPGWLQEHLDNGFPTRAELSTTAEAFGVVRAYGSEGIEAHERLVRAELTPLTAIALRLLARPLQRLLASERRQARQAADSILRRIRGGDGEPAYRAIVEVDVSGARSRQISE